MFVIWLGMEILSWESLLSLHIQQWATFIIHIQRLIRYYCLVYLYTLTEISPYPFLTLQSILGALFRLLVDIGQWSIASCQGRWCFRIWDQRLTERRKIWNLHFNPRIPNGTLSAARSSARSWRVCNDDWSGRILKYRKTWNASLRL